MSGTDKAKPAPVSNLAEGLERRLARALHCDVIHKVDVAVIGAGVGGLAVALAAAGRSPRSRRVALITKGVLGTSGSSPYAQGGIAAAVGPDDTPAEHAADTNRVGRGLTDAGVVEILTKAGPEAIDQLMEWGTSFDRKEGGEFDLGREGGHGRHRVLHAGGDATGREVVRAMTEVALVHEEIDVFENFFVWDLLLDRQGCVIGLLGLRGPQRVAILAGETVMASGGVGQVYKYTSNPRAVTGDGVAMAARAGARLVDLEFVQFHPTTLDVEANASGQVPLLTEALRGDGAWLVDEHGERFMFDIDEAGELAPRDVVARTLFLRALDGKKNFLDLRPVAANAEDLRHHFPIADASCRDAGLDPMSEPVPVTPAAHYYMGGVWADGSGKTSLPGLWACGEVTSTGAHGANRLASNSLLEAIVFGLRIGELLAAAPERSTASLAPHAGFPPTRPEPIRDPDRVEDLIEELRVLAWTHLGIVRSSEGLGQALAELDRLDAAVPRDPLSARWGELRNMLISARLIARSALLREESRGGHYRSDFPEPSRRWERRLFVEPRELLALTSDPQANPVQRR